MIASRQRAKEEGEEQLEELQSRLAKLNSKHLEYQNSMSKASNYSNKPFKALQSILHACDVVSVGGSAEFWSSMEQNSEDTIKSLDHLAKDLDEVDALKTTAEAEVSKLSRGTADLQTSLQQLSIETQSAEGIIARLIEERRQLKKEVRGKTVSELFSNCLPHCSLKFAKAIVGRQFSKLKRKLHIDWKPRMTAFEKIVRSINCNYLKQRSAT